DGDELERSLRDLSDCGSHLKSIAGVPVGLTKFGFERQKLRVRVSRPCNRTLPGAMLEMRRYSPLEAREVIAQAERWQKHFRKTRGETFFHLGDEFYLMSDSPVPSTRHYDGFPQVEDGIGITRLFLDDAKRIIRRGEKASVAGAAGIIACATLIGPAMEREVAAVNDATGARLDVAVVVNQFFGPEINVSGLLSGQDLIRTLRDRPGDSPVYISSTMLSRRTGTMIDDMTLEEVQTALGRRVVPTEHLSNVLADLRKGNRVAA
ncbi:MAG TPA: DUF512 domain-containing protein, partial [Thermomicrobiales bacterium]|nr:DUF512 domain-containing protein [Thermomicrobiales bacterium]